MLSGARVLGAERVFAIGHNPHRLGLATRLGATQRLNSHEADLAERIIEATQGGVGTVMFVGVPAGMESLDFGALFTNNVALRGGIAPVRAYIEPLMQHVMSGRIDPSPVFDLALPLERVAEGYAAMDQRRAIKVILAAG